MLGYVVQNWLRKRRDLGNEAYLKAPNWRNKTMIVESRGDAEAWKK